MEKPALYGLGLAGGKSLRMGKDKAAINWHGKAQQYYLADLLKNFVRKFLFPAVQSRFLILIPIIKTITDVINSFGPYEAILSAFRYNSNCAWFIIACDLPLLDLQTLQYLKLHRK